MNLLAAPLLRLCAWDGWTVLLERRRGRALHILMPETSLLRCPRLFALRRCERFLSGLVLIVLPHYGVTRLITVILALKLLLPHLGIPIP